MLSEITASLELIVLQTKENAPFLLNIVTLLFICFLLGRIFHPLLFLGIIPRKLYGLPGIFISPFLHLNFNHFFFNTIPLVVLSNFILLGGFEYYLQVTFYIMLGSGILIWLFARSAIHIGASAVITGYWAFLVINSYEQGSITAIILGGICVYYFLGIFLGIFPNEKGVSWEGHLFGLITGGVTSLHFNNLL